MKCTPRLGAIAGGFLGFASSVHATDAALPVGTVVELDVLWLVLKLLAAAWGVALLVGGARWGRAILGSAAMAVGLAAGLALLGDPGLLPALLLAFAVFAVVSALEARWPRVAVMLGSLWPLPAMWMCWLLVTGSFDVRPPLVLALAVGGFVLGAVRPQAGRSLQASALGALVFGFLQPVLHQPVVVLVAFFAAVAGHLLVAVGGFGCAEDAPKQSFRTRWFQTLGRGALALAGLLVLVCLAAPTYSPAASGQADRLERLAGQGVLARPALVIGAENNLYLSGRATMLGIAAERGGVGNRVLLPVIGHAPTQAIRRMRAVKDAAELFAMRRAAHITSQTFAEIRPMIRPGRSEAEIDRAIQASFARLGADGIAFEGIVASGANAVLPHYQRNDAVMQKGFVVVDIGSSVGGYASDMTRTFTVRLQPTEAEEHLLEIVAEAHRATRNALRPGVTMNELDKLAKQAIADAGFEGYMTHGVGHHVGLNVHDPGRNELEAGMVVTIEPAVYIPAGAAVDPAYWDLGVRIEDSYLVTEDGCEALTSHPWK